MKDFNDEFHRSTSYQSGRKIRLENIIEKPLKPEIVKLPETRFSERYDFVSLLKSRRSRRLMGGKITIEALSFILWCANGVSEKKKYVSLRTAPSAGALYSVETYIFAKRVNNLSTGLFHHVPEDNSLVQVYSGDISEQLRRACLDQVFVETAPVTIIWTANVKKFYSHYGMRGWRYVYLDAGHVCQNAFLAAEALSLSACPVGAFYDDELKKLLTTPEWEIPIYLLPIGENIEK